MQHFNYFCNKSCKTVKMISSLLLIRNKMRYILGFFLGGGGGQLGVGFSDLGVQRKIWHLSCETSNGAPEHCLRNEGLKISRCEFGY